MPDVHDRHPPPPSSARARSPRPGARSNGGSRTVWVAIAATFAVGGTLGALLGARALARADAEHARSAFKLASAQTAASLKQTLVHEEDLVIAASAFVRNAHETSPEAFDAWTESVSAMQRYPELQNIGLVKLVPAARLASFRTRLRAAPVRPFGPRSHAPTSSVRVVPAGRRPYYCLAVAGVARSIATYIPAGADYCALAPQLAIDGASGLTSYAPFLMDGKTSLGVETPVYRGRHLPSTPAGRRRAFLGWLGELLTPKIVLAAALQGHRSLAVTLRYDSRFSHVAFHAGRAPAGAQVASTELQVGRAALGSAREGWTVQTYGPHASESLLGNWDSLGLAIGGAALSVTLSLLLLLLSTGRVRALRELSQKNRALSHQALHDTLTGLPNRSLVLDRAERLLARAARQPEVLGGALFIDVDDFKRVNDDLGHAAGDQLLRTVADRLLETVRGGDTVGRIGGDEFVVLSELALGGPGLEVLAERLIEVLREPVRLEDCARTISVTVSIGVAGGSYASADELLRDADLALYAAKAAGKDRHVLFEESTREDPGGRRALEVDLGHAIHGQELFLLYQPLCELGEREALGVEALVRWRHPERGVLSPDHFIPLAEESGLIVEIGRWVLGQACSQAAAWSAEGLRVGVSINVSAHQVSRSEFTAEVRAALRESGIEPSCLTLEITETAIARNARAAREQLEEIKALGVRIAIDDFGTGYASLSSLQRLPVDILKIDRSFVAALSGEWSRELHKASELLHAIMGVGQALSLSVIAEGIEQDGQLNALREMGCEMGQGYLFGRPAPAQEVRALFRAQARPAAGVLRRD